MKNLLFQLDTDDNASSFDTIVAYDGGADTVHALAKVSPENLGQIVEGCIFSRSPREKQHTAIFIGGSNLAAGEALLAAVCGKFFSNFRVSVMLDSNGANTTAATAVSMLARHGPLHGKQAVVLAGTGPVGQRAAALLAQEGAMVSITSRRLVRAQTAADAIAARFGQPVTPLEAADNTARARAIRQAQVVFAAGAAGVQLLEEEHWKDLPALEVMADANATPVAGIGCMGIAGIDAMDRAAVRHGKTIYGAIGFGAFKLALQRSCIGRLFERSDRVLDAEEIYAIAHESIPNV
jgi:hypothetical protein